MSGKTTRISDEIIEQEVLSVREKIYSLFSNPSEMTWEQILLNLCMAALLGFLIYLSYAISHRGTIYSKKFNASLVALTVLTGTVMTVIGNNIALSLGMVGALSIVRFRTAIKDFQGYGVYFLDDYRRHLLRRRRLCSGRDWKRSDVSYPAAPGLY